ERRADADEMPLVAAIADTADDDAISLRAWQPPTLNHMIAARGGERHLFIFGACLEGRHSQLIHRRVTDRTCDLVGDVIADASARGQTCASHATQCGDGELHAALPDTLARRRLYHRDRSLPFGCPRRILRRSGASAVGLLPLYRSPDLSVLGR